MKKTIIITLILLSISIGFAQVKENSDLEWHTDLLKVQDLSMKSKKPIFAFFTGSDWCFWCKKIQADVFSKKEFISWAKTNVVLLELDYPRHKQLSPELAQQNNGLQQTFQIAGYPTIWIFDLNKNDSTKSLDIVPYGSLGYPQGFEPDKQEVKFLQEANDLLKKKTK